MCTCTFEEKDIFADYSIFEWRKSSLKSTLNLQALPEKRKENLFTAIYVGGFFISIALVYYVNAAQNLLSGFVNFFSSLTLAPVPQTGISLPAPSNPAVYANLYNAAFELAIAVGILEIVILALRVWMSSPVSRKAETIENIVFWLGASYLIVAYLENMTITGEWFVFWAGIVLIFGLALIARAFVLLAKG
ncbi:MAG TPA: hypothetical protein VK253_05060 [Candidatus Binatia bacterium]|nr:hypothetical protein [Candidatus Binatia bacterium]